MPFSSAVAVTPIALQALAATSIATLVNADGTNGNKFVANRRTLLRVKNTSGSPITVTVNTNYSIYGLAVPDKTFTVPATSGDVIFTGFEEIFDQNAQSEVHVEFSAVTNVTLQVINPI
jgi:hypothetical protein